MLAFLKLEKLDKIKIKIRLIRVIRGFFSKNHVIYTKLLCHFLNKSQLKRFIKCTATSAAVSVRNRLSPKLTD